VVKRMGLAMNEKSVKIALVDDNPYVNENNRLLLNKIQKQKKFSRINFEIKEYIDGKDLLESNIIYDFILMDYEMQQLNGMATAIELEKRNFL